MRRLLPRLVPLVMLTALSGAGARPRVILEAEDLSPSGAWQPRQWEKGYFCATFANDFLSRQAFLRAPSQCERSEAVADITVPKEGHYALFARYACPLMYNVAFSVRLEQGGHTAFRRDFGRLQNPKIWPFGGGIQPMATYVWGGGDNVVWEGDQTEVALKAGRARVVLTAEPQNEPSAERQVDVLLLTPLDDEVRQRLDKWSYPPLDGLLTQAGDLYLRVTNPAAGLAPLVVELTTVEHSPYWVHKRDWRKPLRIGARGGSTDKPTEEDYLRPGQSSPWVEIGSRLDRLNESTLKAAVNYSTKETPGTDALFEFAAPTAAGQRETLKRLRYTDETTQLIRFAVPGNVFGGKPIRTAEEELERILEFAGSLPDNGKAPARIGIRGVFTSHFTGTDTSQRVKDLANAIRHELIGDAGDKGIQVTSLGDEIHLRRVKKSPEADEAFRGYLRSKGVKPADLLPRTTLASAKQNGPADFWSLVELDYDSKETNPRLWYHSQVFGYENGSLLQLKEKTEKITRESGGAMRTGANYSPHPNYWPRELQWVRPFKLGALTMPWSEDYVWGVPELSPQVTGYLVDALRCGAKYHDLPICFYVMPHAPGNTPRSFRLSYYAALAHGAKLLNHFCVTPVVTAYTENYVAADHLPMYKEIHDLAYELGTFEDLLAGGEVRKAEVAILLSSTTDLWNPSPNYNHERKCLYYALRHAGIPVDFVTEDDVADAYLKDYRVLYMSASHMHSAAAKALSKWVEEGGCLFSAAGGGLLDEYDEKNETTLALFGLESAELTQHDALVDTKHTLPRLRPASGVRLDLPGGRCVALPAIGTTQRLTPAEGTQVVGTFHDGSPAAVLRKVGKGQALLVGAFPGAAYVVPALPVRPWDRGTTDDALCHFLPTEFDASVREAILWPVRRASVQPDIALSAPLVEWTAVDSADGTAIMLMNWSGKRIDELTVSVRGELGRRAVHSVEQGRLTPTPTSDGWRVRLPLATTDCLTVRSAG